MPSTYETISLSTAAAIAEQLRQKPDSCLGLPTGRTPLECYRILSEWSASGKLDWSKAHCFALDEYLEMSAGESFASFLQSHLFRHTNLPPQSRFFPDRISNYDQLIADYGGLDLTVLGVGINGHVAFNEPGGIKASWTHCVWLTESTRRANADLFVRWDLVPRKAVTMGIATIMASRKLIIMASGAAKKHILIDALSGKAPPDIPLCFILKHPNLQIFADFDLPKRNR